MEPKLPLGLSRVAYCCCCRWWVRESAPRVACMHAARQRSWIEYGCWVGGGTGVRGGYGWEFPLREDGIFP
jgi:hypothetical protein